MRLMTSDLRLPVRTRVRTMAMSLLPLRVSGMTWRSSLHLGCGEAAWCAGTGLGAFHGITGVDLHNIHADEELEEGRDAGETGADGYGRRFTAREADAVGEREDVWGSDLIGRLMEATEEMAEGAVVGVRGAVGAGAALLLARKA